MQIIPSLFCAKLQRATFFPAAAAARHSAAKKSQWEKEANNGFALRGAKKKIFYVHVSEVKGGPFFGGGVASR